MTTVGNKILVLIMDIIIFFLILSAVFSTQMISLTLTFTYNDCGSLHLLLVHKGNFNMSSYNLNFDILQSYHESLDKFHETLSLYTDTHAAFTFKQQCVTERLKSDLADSSDKLACQDVAISYLKNDVHATFNRIHLLEGVTARQAQELEEVRAGQLEQVYLDMHNNILLHGIQEMRNENWSTTREVAIKFLKEQMRILPEQVDSLMRGRKH